MTCLTEGGKTYQAGACLTHDCLGGKFHDIHKFAIIPEVIHSGTLIVDDIEDGSRFRRGREAVHILHGTATTINCGNLVYFFPQLIIRDSGLPDSEKSRLYGMITGEMTKLHLGQGMDILWSSRKDFSIPLDDYLQMCAYKTGALLSIAVKMGAVLADADNKVVERLGDAAISLGMAFQIMDDILNLKPSAAWGKESWEDIREGKITFMVVDAMARASDADRKRLVALLGSKTCSRQEIDEAIALMDKYGAFGHARSFSEKLVSDAKRIVKDVFEDSAYKRAYLELFDYAVSRGK
jgi:geranylgeranyl pyrophosphate synthase